MPDTLNILFLAAEAEPFIKIGGLADVAGSLPLALRSLSLQAAGGTRLDVRLVLPLHQANRIESVTLRPVTEFSVIRRDGEIPTKIFQASLDGMPVYFVSGAPFSMEKTVYSTDPTPDREKYGYFSMAVLEMITRLDWRPQILHANDWHTALALYALRSRSADPTFSHIRAMLTIHNLPYMGSDGSDVLAAYGLSPISDVTLPVWALTQPLPLGLWSADAIVPVSPTYAREILTPDFGCGLETFLRTRSDVITGILNGLDLVSWDPATDKSLAATFDADDLSGRTVNKSTLQEQLSLPADPRIPVLAMIGRIDLQKGVDITLQALSQITDRPWQFVILGTGDPALENATRNLESDFPGRVRSVIRFDSALGRLIYAGADMFLMPSRYEPCGLAQMIAMRYGCVPVVRATGGLKDTVQEGKTGFLFEKATSFELAEAIRLALTVFSASPERWKRYQRYGMQEDFSWLNSARQYAHIYRSLTSS